MAATISAAVDQVMPEHCNSVGDKHDVVRRDQWMRIRRKFLAIADELKTINGPSSIADLTNTLQVLAIS